MFSMLPMHLHVFGFGGVHYKICFSLGFSSWKFEIRMLEAFFALKILFECRAVRVVCLSTALAKQRHVNINMGKSIIFETVHIITFEIQIEICIPEFEYFHEKGNLFPFSKMKYFGA